LTIWTIGHSNHPFDRLRCLLELEEVEVVVDVRSFPHSRFAPQFNREAIEPALRDAGLRYLFLGEALGGRPSREDHYDADGHALYGPMSEEPGFQAAIDRLATGSRTHRLALLCSEGQPHECHRRLLVGKVLAERGITLRHILPDGTVEPEREVKLSSSDDQAALFADTPPWRSTRSVSRRRRLSTSSAA
jgi:uncharacterized protein (DUF488 family)